MKEAINCVADRFKLPYGWLNSDFVKTSSYSPKLVKTSKLYKTFNQVFTVRTISGEYLIAMKLKSGRQYKNDLSDIIGILAEHEKRGAPIKFEMISKATEELYGGWKSIDEKSIKFIHAIFENGKYEEMYDMIRENEQITKSVLVSFEEKYPGVLSEENINNIVDNYDSKRKDKISVKSTLEKMKNANDNERQKSDCELDER